MASPRGVEPLTFWSVVKRSIQLSYEDSLSKIYISSGWLLKMVASVGIEPTTPRFSVLCSANWAMKPQWRFRRELNPRSLAWQASVITATPRNLIFGCRRRIWTSDLWVMSPTSYQAALSCDVSFFILAEEKGFEPLRRFHDLLVFKTSPFSQTWVFLQQDGASGRTWTGTVFNYRGILSPLRLPISPPRRVTIFY